MTEPSPRRLIPDRPFPAYAYLPGRTPHPTRDPEGHSYGARPDTPELPDPEDWRACGDYLYGIDLFNHGFYWEAHEAWEGLWVACGRRGPTATFLQALINLTALRELGPGTRQYMGLELHGLIDAAAAFSQARPAARRGSGEPLAFELRLKPD
jgi:hypothetical protein